NHEARVRHPAKCSCEPDRWSARSHEGPGDPSTSAGTSDGFLQRPVSRRSVTRLPGMAKDQNRTHGQRLPLERFPIAWNRNVLPTIPRYRRSCENRPPDIVSEAVMARAYSIDLRERVIAAVT